MEIPPWLSYSATVILLGSAIWPVQGYGRAAGREAERWYSQKAQGGLSACCLGGHEAPCRGLTGRQRCASLLIVKPPAVRIPLCPVACAGGVCGRRGAWDGLRGAGSE